MPVKHSATFSIGIIQKKKSIYNIKYSENGGNAWIIITSVQSGA